MSDHVVSEESIVFVRDSCGVTRERAVELLEAVGGSVERAVELNFSQHARPATPSSSGTKRKQSPNSKQSSLVTYFGKKGAGNEGATKKSKKPDASRIPISKNDEESHSTPPPRKRPATTTPKQADTVPIDPRLHYAALANAFAEMVATTKRLQKLAALESALSGIVTALGGIHDDTNRTNDAQVLCSALELILGADTLKLQVSGSAVSKAILAVTGASSTKLREAYRKTGDLGDAAELFMRNQRLLIQPKPLTITSVHSTLTEIANQQGKGSQNQRHTLMVKLLRSCKSHEMKFLVRTLLGNMRLGANIRTVLAALASAIESMESSSSSQEKNDMQTAVKTVQDTFDFCPRLDKLSYALLCGGIARMKESCVMEVGTPIHPMLANPAHSLEEVEKFMTCDDNDKSSPREAVAEWKYDGMRCQAHYNGSSMKLFSRHLLETTDQFPDAVKAILNARRNKNISFMIDSEIVGVEESVDEPGVFRLLPFQDLSTRRGADGSLATVRIRVFVFDIMYLNGESLAKQPLWKRQENLREHFDETVDFKFAQSITLPAYNEVVVSEFLELAVKGGAEGLMVKLTGRQQQQEKDNNATATSDEIISCPYESGGRSQTWLKVKRDYVAGFADTIDVVPIGAWHGNGRKAQKKFLSPVLLAVYDDDEDVYRSICRCMSFTDVMYDGMRDYYLHGRPYPSGVGMSEGDQALDENAKETEVLPYIEEVDDDDDGNDDKPDGSVGVNCYPSRPSALVVTNESPPIWFKPSEVFEVSFADLSLSKTHTAAAGLVDAERGVALRFPRFKRRRPDKRIDQATTCAQIAELFAKQTKQGKS